MVILEGGALRRRRYMVRPPIFDTSSQTPYGQGMKHSNTTLPPDYHSHTRLCKHAEGTPIDYARAAATRGLPAMICTEHSPFPEPFSPHVRMALDEFEMYCEWVAEAAALSEIPVFLGLEADYYNGCEPFLSEWLPQQPFDYVLGSVHFVHYDREQDHALTGVCDYPDIVKCWEVYFDCVGKLADTGLYDAAAHLDLPKKFRAPPPPEEIERIVKPALDKIAAAGMAMEINTSGFIHGCAEQYPSQTILEWACERGIPITFGSDSHQPERMGADFERAVEVAQAAGYTQRAEYQARQRTLVPLA